MLADSSVYTANEPVLAEILFDKVSFTGTSHFFIYFVFVANTASRTLTRRKKTHALQRLTGSRDKFSIDFLLSKPILFLEWKEYMW